MSAALWANGLDEEANEFLERAYQRVMLVANQTRDEQLRGSWLENVTLTARSSAIGRSTIPDRGLACLDRFNGEEVVALRRWNTLLSEKINKASQIILKPTSLPEKTLRRTSTRRRRIAASGQCTAASPG